MQANIWKAYAGACLKNTPFFGALAVPYFLDWLRVDYTRLFLLQAWFLFWILALEIPTGIIADKFGRSVSVASGCVLFAADMLSFGLGAPYPMLFLAEFIGAVGTTLMSGAEEALLYDTLVALGEADAARRYFARVATAATAGLLVAFPVGTYIASRGDYPRVLLIPFLMSAGTMLLAAAAYGAMREPPHVKPTETFLRMGIQGLQTIFGKPALRAYVVNTVSISSVTFFAFWFYQPLALRAGVPLAHVGLIAAGFNLFGVALLANSTRIEAAVGIRRLLFVTAAAPALLFGALAWARSPWVVVPAIFLLVGCKLLRAPVLAALINYHIESGNRATVLSSVSLLERSITFVLYPLVGWLADRKVAEATVPGDAGRGESIDLALWVLALLCALFAVATRPASVRLPDEG